MVKDSRNPLDSWSKIREIKRIRGPNLALSLSKGSCPRILGSMIREIFRIRGQRIDKYGGNSSERAVCLTSCEYLCLIGDV